MRNKKERRKEKGKRLFHAVKHDGVTIHTDTHMHSHLHIPIHTPLHALLLPLGMFPNNCIG